MLHNEDSWGPFSFFCMDCACFPKSKPLRCYLIVEKLLCQVNVRSVAT